MAGSQAAKSAAKLLRAAPEDPVNRAGEYFVEAADIIEELKGESRPASVFVATQLAQNPFSRSEKSPMTLALFYGYALRIGASRRGVAPLSAEELGVDLMPRTEAGEINWAILGGGDERGHEALDGAFAKLFGLAKRNDVYGVDPPIWRFVVAAVTMGCDDAGKIHRSVSFDDMVSLVSTGYLVGMFDEVAGWDATAPGSAPA